MAYHLTSPYEHELNPMIRLLGVALLIAAYALLIPGLTQPMLSVVGTVEKSDLVDVGREIINNSEGVSPLVQQFANMMIEGLKPQGAITALDKTQSILGTASELFNTGHQPVAALIVLFSVIIPVTKGVLTVISLTPIPVRWQKRLGAFLGAISKWSMADVFVVAIFVAFLAANGLEGSSDLVSFDAQLGPGFWFFVGFCALSILATQVLNSQHERSHSG